MLGVVIPCLRQAGFLPDAIASVRAQTLAPDELVVVAGSEEDAAAGRALGVETLEREPWGLADARNVGIAATSADRILPLDADDQLTPTFLERTSAVDADIVTTYSQEFGARENIWRLAPLERLPHQNAIASTSLFRRRLWEAVGGYDVGAIGYEDWDFWLKCMRLGPSVRVIHEALLRYRIHAASMMATQGAQDELWRAMMRLRHAELYGAEQLAHDRLTVAAMPGWVANEVRRRLTQWPGNRALREAASLIAPTEYAAPAPLPRPDVRGSWRAGLLEELRFWEAIIQTGGLQWPDEWRDKLDPNLPLQETFRDLLASAGSTVYILDVGAGPLTSLGKRWVGHEVEITAIDPLADEYARLLRKYGHEAPVPTTEGHGESLTARFATDTFDLVHARNSLDHTYDPLAVLRSMLAVTKPGGYVWLSHAKREADAQHHTGLHQWNLYPEAGCFWVEGGGEHVNVSEELSPLATIEVQDADSWFTVTMQKRRHGT